MTLFKDRKNVFEALFSAEGKQGFKIEARLSKHYGLWAADKLGLKGKNAEIYAREIVSANLEEPGFEDIFRRVQKDFDEKEVHISRHVMESELQKYLAQAKKEVIESKENAEDSKTD